MISTKEAKLLNEYFQALNYLSVGQLYLLDNPLLRRKLDIKDIKKNVVGHWGSAPGQNFIYMHLNRLIIKNKLKMIYIAGPGHAGQAILSNLYLEGTYTRFYKDITRDEKGMQKFFKQFSFPGGVSSHVAPAVPGSIHEGGELGYSLSHAAGAVLDNKDLIASCVVGDGEAETGPLATSWNFNKFLNYKKDGVVLPILHRNGYKISNPTIFGKMTEEEIKKYFEGLGYYVYFVEGHDEIKIHKDMANALDKALKDIEKYKKKGGKLPIIVVTTPKGWTGPKEINGKRVEGTFRSHQVPIQIKSEEDINLLEKWLKSYHPENLFDLKGRLVKRLKVLIPPFSRSMGANLNTNGGILLKELNLPNPDSYTLHIRKHGEDFSQDTTNLSRYIKDVFVLNKSNNNFRMFGPDEALSNRLNHIFESENRTWNYRTNKYDEYLATDGKVFDSYLSEHLSEGMLEGYLLTGRHGFINSYEAFIRVVDSMIAQHAKWIKVTKELSWRMPISSLNILLTSHAFQQDHNGYTHQDPGFLNHMASKKKDIVNIYLPPDTNTLIYTFDKCLKTKNKINVVVASKHERPQWLSKNQAKKFVGKGIGIWDFATNDEGNPDIVFASSGETPTLESLAAISILKENIKGIKIRYINVLDLMKLESHTDNPNGLKDIEYDYLFTKDKPIIFNFHGYQDLIKSLTYRRTNKNMSIHGYMEEGTITTSFDIRVQNEIDRFHLVMDALEKLKLDTKASKDLLKWCKMMLKEHNEYIKEYGEDIPYITKWRWK